MFFHFQQLFMRIQNVFILQIRKSKLRGKCDLKADL